MGSVTNTSQAPCMRGAARRSPVTYWELTLPAMVKRPDESSPPTASGMEPCAPSSAPWATSSS